MQPHSGAVISLLAQLRYDAGDSYYKVASTINGKEYQITLQDVYRHELTFRVGNVYPCFTKVHLEVGNDFSLQTTKVKGEEVTFLNMSKECQFRIHHSHTNVVEERYQFEFNHDLVLIRKGEYRKENGWSARFEGRYEAGSRRSELKDTIVTDKGRKEETYYYIIR